ncbi:MAG: glucose-6-phosphate dehydrogenase [Chlorobia bacterium]|nr:glucose-6-phosphate dehydrogenase [Fimbriimonadaceae bacterium]
MTRPSEPAIITIFGANGDLAKRKLLPALFNLYHEKLLPENFLIVGNGRRSDLETWKRDMREGVETFSRRGKPDEAEWQEFSSNLQFAFGGLDDRGLYEGLRGLITQTEASWGRGANRIHYLSIPPSMVELAIHGLNDAGLNDDKKRDRVVIEKPFGTDLTSAEDLNTKVTAAFDECQVYRIDHYLGKETVQNLLAFRFGNALFEPIWNRSYIDHVQITVSEEVGVEGRGAFYESAGALRDMIQNHLLQVMCMIAMEPPVSFEADEVRNKKVDVLKAVRPIPPGELYKYAVRGQYGAGHSRGEKEPGYRQEEGVDPASSTETYAALQLYIDNWRWQNVPFYLRTGKRMPCKVSQVSIEFKPVPHQIFPGTTGEHFEPNRLIINIAPKEGIVLRFQSKQPGKGMRLQTVNMDFYYSEAFHVEPPEAYETLLYDVMLGDSTLFMRADQEHIAWSIIQPILSAWTNTPSADFPNYAAGTWGPEAGEALIARDGRSWHSLPVEGV